MTLRIRILVIIVMMAYFGIIAFFVYRRRLEQKYSLIWVALGCAFVVFAIWPDLLGRMSAYFGIWDPMNAFFALSFFFLVLVCLALTIILSGFRKHIKNLTQACALYEKRIWDLEKQMEKLRKGAGEE